MVGDSFEIDILGANRAGIPGIWLNWRTGEERSGLLFRTIHSLGALPAALENLNSGFDPALRSDSLTGCGNILSYLEWLSAQSPIGPASLVTVDLNNFAEVNRQQGHERGDAVLRWVGLVLQDMLPGPVFRTGGDEFLAALRGDDTGAHERMSQAVFERLNQEAARVGLGAPAASLAIVHYPAAAACSPAQVMEDTRRRSGRMLKDAGQREIMAFSMEQLEGLADATRLVDYLIVRMVELGGRLDEARRLAFSDPLTGLPNVRAAMQRLEAGSGECQAILLIDGDNLKPYNTLGGYAAGDRMICDLGALLEAHLRPGDFLARWRTGDEFLILLATCDLEDALVVAERLRLAVSEASQNWLRPISISIGAAAGRHSAEHPSSLLAEAESALERAKRAGKNRVVAAPGVLAAPRVLAAPGSGGG